MAGETEIILDDDYQAGSGFEVTVRQPGVMTNNRQLEYKLYEVGSGDNNYISNATLKLEVNKAGSFEFDILPFHTHYSILRRYVHYVTVRDEGEVIFYGRILTMSLSFNGTKHVVCEGLMANLLDCPMYNPLAPTTDKLFTIYGTLGQMFDTAISAYRNLVRTDIVNSGNYPNGTSSITLEDIDVSGGTSVGDFVTSELIEAYGGFLEMEYTTKENGEIYGKLHWKPDPSMNGYSVSTNSQPITFGVNLLDISAESDDDEIMTGIIPMWEDSNNETHWITHEGSRDVDGETTIYRPEVTGASVQSLSAVGIKVVKLPGVKTQQKASTYASNYVSKYCSNYLFDTNNNYIDFDSYTIRAIDLHYAGYSAMPKIKLYDKVNIVCNDKKLPFKIDKELTCTTIEISIDTPENSSYTFSVYRPKASSNDKVLTRQIKRKRI